MIADTSFVIDLLKNEDKALEKAQELQSQNRGFSLSAPTVYELLISIERAGLKERNRIREIIESQNIYRLDREASTKAAKIQSRLIDEGQRIGHIDAQIAGTAHYNSEAVITRNVEEFERVEGLEIEKY